MSIKLLLRILGATAVCLLIGYLSSMATETGMDSWYESLRKPGFTPPDELFAPMWVTLYILMGIAAGIVWNKGFYHKWVKTALYFFSFQLLLNGAWSLLFFGLREPFWALVDIVLLFILILVTIRWFKIVSDTAAWLLVPYAVWVLYAAALNFEIWRLN